MQVIRFNPQIPPAFILRHMIGPIATILLTPVRQSLSGILHSYFFLVLYPEDMDNE